MILTGPEIKKAIGDKTIHISPFNEHCLNPNSYNYHLGDKFVEIDGSMIIESPEKIVYEIRSIPPGGIVLNPANLYLCNTLEEIGSTKFVMSLIGKSSIGRLGLFLQLSANMGHQNEIHQWTLELKCCKPIRIYPNMIIGQVTFWETTGDYYSFNGYFANFQLPTPSKGL